MAALALCPLCWTLPMQTLPHSGLLLLPSSQTAEHTESTQKEMFRN